MKVIHHLSYFIIMLVFMASFSHCSSAQKLQKNAPVEFGDVYCQSWVAGVKEGGSGLNLFIPVTDTSISLDSVFFRGKVAKLEFSQENSLYIGRFKTEFNQPKDIILSSDPKEEYANKMLQKETLIPFDLKDDECVVSYKKENDINYYKISNIKQKEPLNYPSAPPNKY